MSEEQAVYNANWLAEKCEKIAGRMDEAADKLRWSELLGEWTETRLEPFVLMRLGARLGDVVEQVAQIVEDVGNLVQQRVVAQEEMAEVERRLTSYPGGNAITLPVTNRSSAAFLVELGEQINRRLKALREAADIMRSIAHGLRHAGDEGRVDGPPSRGEEQ